MVELKILDLNIHKYANLTPLMVEEQYIALKLDIKDNGQIEPVRVCRGLIYDGRHRFRALNELGSETIKAIVDDTLSEEDIKSQVYSFENRRHQTATQLAISAYKEYMLLLKNEDTKESQGSVAERFGVGRKNLSEVKSLAERAPDLIDFLFDGKKLNIGTDSMPNMTNNIRAINAWIKSDRLSRMIESNYEFKLTDDENDAIKLAIDEIENKYGLDIAVEASKRIIAKHTGTK